MENEEANVIPQDPIETTFDSQPPVEEPVETVEAEETDGAAHGAPIPTNELNPDNPSIEGPSSTPFDGLFGGMEDYHPLFEQYNEALGQQGKNIDYLKNLTDTMASQLNKCEHRVWELRLQLGITIGALIAFIISYLVK